MIDGTYGSVASYASNYSLLVLLLIIWKEYVPLNYQLTNATNAWTLNQASRAEIGSNYLGTVESQKCGFLKGKSIYLFSAAFFTFPILISRESFRKKIFPIK